MLKNKNPSVFRDCFQQPMFGDRKYKLQRSVKDSRQFLQNLELYNTLKVHKGCVNTISWNETGQYILSGSDDQNIVITNPYKSKIIAQYRTAHRANIFSAKFLPQSGDRGIVSCSGDGVVLYTELTNSQYQLDNCNNYNEANLNYFNCHSSGTTYEVLTVPTEPKSFMSCGEDCTVRFFDLRKISQCRKTCCKDNILIFSPSAITAMALSPISNNYIAIGSSDSQIRIYDRRFLSLIDFSIPGTPDAGHILPVKAFAIPSLEKRPYRVTSLNYSSDEKELLVSYSSDHLYLFDITKEGIDVKLACCSCDKIKTGTKSNAEGPSPPVRRLRLRGDWSDTGPDARPERELANRPYSSRQAGPQLQASIMRRMTEVLSRMISDPQTQAALNQMDVTEETDFTESTTVMQSAGPNIEDRSDGENINASNANLVDPREGSSHASESDRASPQPSSSFASSSSSKAPLKRNASPVSDNSDDDDDDDDYIGSSNTNDRNLRDLSEQAVIDFDYMKMKFMGHRNARTMIKEATFWGDDYIMSGSDCGHIFAWERKTGKLCMLMEADQHVVNCLQPHPTLPYLATSGIDYDVKLWVPIDRDDEDKFDLQKANDLMKRNAVMLEETKDTITVPAIFMVRMLACIRSLRRRRQRPLNN